VLRSTRSLKVLTSYFHPEQGLHLWGLAINCCTDKDAKSPRSMTSEKIYLPRVCVTLCGLLLCTHAHLPQSERILLQPDPQSEEFQP